MTETDALADDLRTIAGPIVVEDGAELVDVIVKGHPGSRMVRLIVDAEDGLDVERIARLSRQVSAQFDDLDPIAGRYTLQVSSPGVDRPLVTARDFARNVGRPVRIASTAGSEVEGVVTATGSDSVTVEVDGEDVEVRLEDVREARIQLPW